MIGMEIKRTIYYVHITVKMYFTLFGITKNAPIFNLLSYRIKMLPCLRVKTCYIIFWLIVLK